MYKNLILILLLALLVACANSERPKYVLTDGQLRSFQSGDYRTYAVLNADSVTNKLERYTETLEAKNIFSPDLNTLNVLQETYSQTQNIIFPFIGNIFSQDDDGNLMLLGISRGGETYWLMQDITSDLGKQVLPNDLSQWDTAISFSSPLQFCENQVCSSKGTIDIEIEKLGTETIETNYADFETYKVSIGWDISLFDADNANIDINQSLNKSGSIQWLHPAIGVTKFIYEVHTDTQAATLIGNLTETNISIPGRYKSE